MNGRTVERYPASYRPENSLVVHLRYALRYEPTDFGVLAPAFDTAGSAQAVEAWIRSEPTGAYARRAWFRFEWLTGRTLDVPDAGAVSYVHALDPVIHVTARGVPSRRHRVTDNTPGRPGCAPMVRRTECLDRWQKKDLAAEARAIATGCDPAILDFAAGLRRDIAAIQAALDLPWTTSPVEGQINRLKMLKRAMYGRAGFKLLRARVLHAA